MGLLRLKDCVYFSLLTDVDSEETLVMVDSPINVRSKKTLRDFY